MQSNQAKTPPGAATEVTLWFRTNEKGEWMMNHLEDGHCPNDLPTPKLPTQKTIWGRGTWAREHAWLSGDKPPKVLHDEANQQAREQLTGRAS